MKSATCLTEGHLYEIINPHIHYRFHDHIGWFTRIRKIRENEPIFLYLEQEDKYSVFIVDGMRVKIPRSYVRHLRPLK